MTKNIAPHILISVDALSNRITDPDLVILDCRYYLNDFSKGRKEYLENHIPGAFFMDIGKDLSSPVIPGITGRHPLPHPEVLASAFRSAGINQNTFVVAYDQANGVYAARLWWLLFWLGHDNVAVLNGGFAAWKAKELPVDNQWPPPRKGNFIPHEHPDLVIERFDLKNYRENLVDSREYRRYTGEVEPIDPIAGHIPGAVCIPYGDNTDEKGMWKSPDELKKRFEMLSQDDTAPVFYCGSGVTACHNILAYKMATGKDAKLYPGSWSEWINYYPPATGPE